MTSKLQCITLMDDIGEVWLKDGEIISFIYWSEGYFSDYHRVILDSIGVECEFINLSISDDKDYDKSHKAWGDPKKMAKLLPTLLEKYKV